MAVNSFQTFLSLDSVICWFVWNCRISTTSGNHFL